MHKVLVINGPNLNLLGKREPEIYGSLTLSEIEKLCLEKATALGLSLEFFQSNHEGELVTAVQKAREDFHGIIINPAAYSHTSIALLDALSMCDMPKVEVHLSNIHRRESFRHTSFVSKAVDGVICGLGAKGYLLALEAVASFLGKE